MCRLTVFVPILTTILPVFAAAQATETDQESPNTPHQIPRVEKRIEVDGALDEKVWEQAWTMTLDYEVYLAGSRKLTCTGSTTLASIRADGKPVRFHDRLLAALESDLLGS